MRARLIGLAVLCLTASATALSGSATGEVPVPPEDDYGAAAAGCVPTKTQTVDVPRLPGGANPGWIVGDGIWLSLGDDVPTATVYGSRQGQQAAPTDTYPGSIRANGSVRVKFLWRRAKRGAGRLWVMGRSTSGTGRFRLDTGNTYPRRKFVPSGVVFPAPGCWSLGVKSGKARLSFVVWVAVGP
jgi:hypothetical protein